MRARAVLLLAVLAVADCGVDAAPCASDADCDGTACADGYCTTTAATRDGGRPDDVEEPRADGGATADAGTPDAGDIVDAGFVDAGELVDTGVVDAGDLVDTGVVDAGEPTDTGVVDGGEIVDASFGGSDAGRVVDAGDAGPDALPDDAGTCTGVATFARCPADAGLALCLPFDVGTVYDDLSPYDHATTSVDMSFTSSFEGYAGGFGGTARFDVADHPALRTKPGWAVDAWIRYTTDLVPSDGDKLVVADRHDDWAMRLVNEDGTRKIECVVVHTQTLVTLASAGPVPQSPWVHVACLRSDTMLYAVVGDVAVDVALSAPPDDAGASFSIGADAPDGGFHFVGGIDRFRVWERGWSDVERQCADLVP